MPTSPYSILIIGLDGATFDLMLPWIDQGQLPHLGSLIARGTRGQLESTMPPITPCAWSSFMTGLNPGRHGLLDFVEPVQGTHGLRFTNAGSRTGETLWGYASRHGRCVGAVNVPMTYPPEPVHGFMISGLDTPHERSPFMYPAAIREDLRRQSIRYRIDQQHLGNMRTDRRRRQQLEAIKSAESARTDAFRYLCQKFQPELRMLVYGATDQVQHHFWHYLDQQHDKFDARGAQLFGDAILEIYRHVDAQIGQLLQDCDERTVVIVMSDHGFGPTSNVRIRLNQLLEQEGLLRYVPARPSSRLRQSAAAWADKLLRATLSSDTKRTLAGLLPGLRVWFENLERAEIDWEQTVAYANETYRSSPAIWINRELGLTESRVAELRQQIKQRLLELKDPHSGRAVVSQVIEPRELYDGPFADNAPDLLPSWWEDGFLMEDSIPGGSADSIVERCTAPVVGGVEFVGSHRMDGVLIVSGQPVREGQVLQGARIIDVAPTILHLMGLQVPADMDGVVLTGCLGEDYLRRHPIRFTEEHPVGLQHGGGGDAFTDEEQELIARRLEALGYLSR